MNDTSKVAQIIPLKNVLKDFAINLWHLRVILGLLIVFIVINYFAFSIAESNNLKETDSVFLIILDNILHSNLSNYIPISQLGILISILNSLYGYFILGLIIWIVQASINDQKVKKAKYFIF